MNLKARIKKLEQDTDRPGDVVAVLNAGRERMRLGESTQPGSTPPEWEHSRNPLARLISAARRRLGM